MNKDGMIKFKTSDNERNPCKNLTYTIDRVNNNLTVIELNNKCITSSIVKSCLDRINIIKKS